jgi:capsular polysaccharide biosynthesis protein
LLELSYIRAKDPGGRSAAIVDAIKNSSIRKLYIQLARRVPQIVSVARAIIRFARGEVVFRQLLVPEKNSPREWRTVTKLSHFVKAAGLTPVVLAHAESAAVLTATTYPENDNARILSQPQEINFPEIYTVSVADALVVPATNFIILKNHIICHDLLDLLQQKPSEELISYLQFNSSQTQARTKLTFHIHDELPEAAHFLDAAALNYAHWITEILPRIALFCSKPMFAHVPLLIDEYLPKSMLDSLEIVAGESRKIFVLSRGIAVRVKTLHVVSVSGYIPFEFRHDPDMNKIHGQFSPVALRFLRELVLKSLTTNSALTETPKKIFIERTSTQRVLKNQSGLKNIFSENSFECISPETLSFLDQARVFANAEEIVGATGAAFANLLFCSSPCKLTILIGDHPETPYGYWANIATAIGLRVRFVLGFSDAPLKAGIHRDFSISEKTILSLIEHG